MRNFTAGVRVFISLNQVNIVKQTKITFIYKTKKINKKAMKQLMDVALIYTEVFDIILLGNKA